MQNNHMPINLYVLAHVVLLIILLYYAGVILEIVSILNKGYTKRIKSWHSNLMRVALIRV